MKPAERKDQISKQDVAAFLSDNPSIFQQHPELLELISLSDSRGTASLIERQVAMLNERLRQHKSQHSQFVQVARENEQISDNFTHVICQMIGFTNLSEFATEFPKELRNKFEIDEVSFKTAQAVSRKPSDSNGYTETLRRLINNRAVCDNRWPSTIMNLFFSTDINSAALVPMRTNSSSETLGVLALGSRDPERYTNDLGTAHLDRLGLMSGICLARLQPSSV
ncbi:DUF484 family protein [Arenicella xantha]|uniref:DUF484 family protein n=1 Tax=Arenicella xantha TaxID=644221 RepID=A0A395JQH4_9GAMM|nr:DUF484 family protein [Arenicella xantha]RBP53613.1 hypothetical protein DFR28_1011000 [Arenicella xantha]